MVVRRAANRLDQAWMRLSRRHRAGANYKFVMVLSPFRHHTLRTLVRRLNDSIVRRKRRLNHIIKEIQMLRKISIALAASAASVLLAGGIANAQQAGDEPPVDATYQSLHANDPSPPKAAANPFLDEPPAIETYRDRMMKEGSAQGATGATGVDAPHGSAVPEQDVLTD